MIASFKTVKYGQLVEVINESGFHSGMKIHFFNQKGVLLGNIYQFVPYEKIRFRPEGYVWERQFYNQRWEKVQQFFYEMGCRIVTLFIRHTQMA